MYMAVRQQIYVWSSERLRVKLIESLSRLRTLLIHLPDASYLTSLWSDVRFTRLLSGESRLQLRASLAGARAVDGGACRFDIDILLATTCRLIRLSSLRRDVNESRAVVRPRDISTPPYMNPPTHTLQNHLYFSIFLNRFFLVVLPFS